jgi:small subunit ribosomal protein S4
MDQERQNRGVCSVNYTNNDMKLGPKFKICKRYGAGLYEKCQSRSFTLSESRPGRTRKGRVGARSDFAIQHMEKQRARLTYGVGEKQFVRYVRESALKKGSNATGELLRTLEMRLDNVVYRLGFAKTRAFARQLVSHGHICVNGKKMNIPSYRVSVNDIVEIRQMSRDNGAFRDLDATYETHSVPGWISVDQKMRQGKIISKPEPDGAGESTIDLKAVVEFYSR